MKLWGIALLTFALGVTAAIWLRGHWDSSNFEPEVDADPPPVVDEPDPAKIRDEILTGVAIMESRIADLERLAAQKAAEDLAHAEAQQESPPKTEPLPEPAAEGDLVGEPVDQSLIPIANYDSPPLDFYEPLEPYGEWLNTDQYGDVWQPDIGVGGGSWAPYTDGGWEYTDVGWGFVSDEPWGWACYHYGRWTKFDRHGWCWVPGYDWAPSWVSWRVCDTHIGWAPLPPSCGWRAGIGIGSWVDARCDIGPARYCFVPFNKFGGRDCRRSILDRHHNARLILASHNVTDIRHLGHHGNRHPHVRVCNFGPDPVEIHRRGGRKFDRLEVAMNAGSRGIHNRVAADRGQVQMHFAKTPSAPRTTAKKPVINVRPDRGWAVVADHGEELRVRQHLIAEATGRDPKVSTHKAALAVGAPTKLVSAPAASSIPPKVAASGPVSALPGVRPARRLNVASDGAGDSRAEFAQARERQVDTERQQEAQRSLEALKRQREEEKAAEALAAEQEEIGRRERFAEEQRLAIAQQQQRQNDYLAHLQRKRVAAADQQRTQQEQQRLAQAEQERQQRARAEADARAREEADAYARAQTARQQAEAKRDRDARDRQRAEQTKAQMIAQQRAAELQRRKADESRRQADARQADDRRKLLARRQAEARSKEDARRALVKRQEQAESQRRSQEQARARAAADKRAADSARQRQQQQQKQKAADASRQRAASSAAAAAAQRRAAEQQRRPPTPSRSGGNKRSK